MTATISVRSLAGRLARTSPRGPFIPSDRYIDVEATSYVMRLLNVHGDIELNPAPLVVEPEVIQQPKAATVAKKEV